MARRRESLIRTCTLALLAALACVGCASDEALFAEYERQCEVPRIIVAPPAMVVAVLNAAAPASPFEPAVYFAYRSADLDGQAQATLRRLRELFDDHPEVHLFLRAQTDARGSIAVNERLAEARLESVRAQLLGLGIPPARIRGVGIGKREAQEGAAVAVMDASRRVDVELVDESGRPLAIVLADADAAE